MCPEGALVHPAQGNALGTRANEYFLLCVDARPAQRANRSRRGVTNRWPVRPQMKCVAFSFPRALPWAGRREGPSAR